jgi:hypothetical protein
MAQSDPSNATIDRKKLRRMGILLGLIALGFVMVDALGVFDSKSYDVITHGNHSHYTAKDRAKGVDAGTCPQYPPGPNQFISPQCQMVSRVTSGEVTYYIPEERNPNVPDQRFPTRAPELYERITPEGQVVSVSEEDDDH